VIGQAFAETAKTNAPRAGQFDGVFEIHTYSRFGGVGGPAVATSSPLVTVAADEFSLLGFYVAETGYIDAVGAIAERLFVFVTGHFSAGACAHVVIHEVVAEFAAGVGEAVGKFGSGGIEQDARRLER